MGTLAPDELWIYFFVLFAAASAAYLVALILENWE